MDVSMGNASMLTRPAEGLPLGSLLRLFRRRAWLLILCGLLGAAGAFAYARTLPKTYTASSLVAVEGDRIAIPELQGALRTEAAPDPMPFVRTEMQAVASRDLLRTVTRKLNLAGLPEFNGSLRKPGFMDQAKAAMKALLPQSHEDTGPAPSQEEAVLNAVARSLAVFQDNRSLVIEVSFSAQDPALAAQVVNTLLSEYVASRASRRVQANQGANSALTERIDQVRVDLAGLEQKMRDLRTKGELVGLRAGSVGQQQVEELATAATRAGVERAQLQTQYDRAAALAKQGSSDALASVLGSPTVSQLRAQESAASRRVAELGSHYGSNYPGMESARAELGSIQGHLRQETDRIVNSLGTQLKAARENEANLNAQLEASRRTGVTGENARAELEQLQQEVTSRRTLYQTLLERAQQTVVQPSGTETPDVRVVTQAFPPNDPSAPNIKVTTGSGAAAGLMLGCLLTLTGLRNSRTFHTPADLAAASGFLPSGTLRHGARRRVAAVPSGAEAEALRGLRFRVARLGHTSAPHSVMCTGLSDRDHAARVAVGLARVAALDGDRVLLVEGDFDRPRVLQLLNMAQGELGLVLQGGKDWRDALLRDAQTPLHVLGLRQSPSQAHAALTGTAFQNLLVEASAQYDLVVLTCAAAGRPDALGVAQRTDAVVLVIDGKADRREQVQDATTRLSAMSRNPLATIMLSK